MLIMRTDASKVHRRGAGHHARARSGARSRVTQRKQRARAFDRACAQLPDDMTMLKTVIRVTLLDLVLGLLICSTPWLERTREAALRGGEPQGRGGGSRPATRTTPCLGNPAARFRAYYLKAARRRVGSRA